VAEGLAYDKDKISKQRRGSTGEHAQVLLKTMPADEYIEQLI